VKPQFMITCQVMIVLAIKNGDEAKEKKSEELALNRLHTTKSTNQSQ